MRSSNIIHLLLTALTTAEALRITMRKSLLSTLRDKDVTIPCDIYELNTQKPISVLWKMRSENGTEHYVYEYNAGSVTAFRPGCKMEETEVLRGNAQLQIPRVKFSDEGEYTCRVINNPDLAEGHSTLQVSAPPLAEVSPDNPTIELGTEKTVKCEVHNFYPQDLTMRWAQYRKGSSDCEFLNLWTCVKKTFENPDGTFNVTSLLTLNPQMEDNGNTFSCLINHRSLPTEISRNFTLTVTEREDNTRAVIAAVIVTLLCAGFLALLAFLYLKFIKKDPPILSEITGNDTLIDMNRTTLTCQVMNFRPNDIQIDVRIERSGNEMKTIYSWRSESHPAPVRMSRDDGDGGGDVEQGLLMNGSAGHEDRPLELEMVPRTSIGKLGSFSCQCSLHITPSYELDNGAKLSVHVKHPALTSPASVYRTLNVTGVSPKLLSIMAPVRVIHDEQLTLTCPINGFKPRPLTITWLKRDRNCRETELIKWTTENLTINNERYSHHLKEDEHDDKSYSFLSALTMKPNVKDDDGVTYICRTFHPATNHSAEKEHTMKVTALPVLDSIERVQDVVYVGKKLDLSCRIHSFYPRNINATWFIEDVIISSNTADPLEEDGELGHVTSKCNYTPTMKDLMKNIRCKVQHESLSNPKHVIWTLKELVSSPTLCDITCVPKILEPNKPLTLSCAISNMYPGAISTQWYLGLTKCGPSENSFQSDTESKIFSGTTELTIIPTPNHHGTLTQLEIIHSGKVFTKQYQLYLEGFPVLKDITMDPRTPDFGKPLTLCCLVTGCMSRSITEAFWSEQGEERRTSNGDDLFYYLTIKPTALDHGKVFRFTLKHKDMESPIVKQIHLRLPEKSPTLSDIIAHSARIRANEEATLQVTISGFCPGELQIKWYKEFGTFPQSNVSMSDKEIGPDHLYRCSSTVTFTPSESDHGAGIRCEVTHNKTVREKRYALDLKGSDTAKTAQKSGPERLRIREITCVTERPRMGEAVTLVAYIEGCQAADAEFSWYRGMFILDEGIVNKQEGSGCTSTVTFTPENGTDCTVKLEVFYNYQTDEKSYTLQLE